MTSIRTTIGFIVSFVLIGLAFMCIAAYYKTAGYFGESKTTWTTFGKTFNDMFGGVWSILGLIVGLIALLIAGLVLMWASKNGRTAIFWIALIVILILAIVFVPMLHISWTALGPLLLGLLIVAAFAGLIFVIARKA